MKVPGLFSGFTSFSRTKSIAVDSPEIRREYMFDCGQS